MGTTRTRSAALFFALLLGVGATTSFLLARRMSRTSKAVDDLRAELAVVQGRELPAPVVIQQVRREPARPEASSAPASEAPAAAPPKKPQTREEHAEQLRLMNETRAEECDQKFGAEARDPTWSNAATALLRERFSGQELSALTISSDCKSTLCRIDFSFSDPEAGRIAVGKMTSEHPWSHSQFFTHFDLESKRGFAYLSREGRRLPEFTMPVQ
jgi:hypothetical protein